MDGRFVAYYRTSTKRQDLGIEAQKADVINYLNGGGWKLIDEFEEKESGTQHENRPALVKAMALCKKRKATLVIAKLDRLARNLHFITGLMESGVKFVACDMPHAKDFEIHIRATLAQEEARLISERTSAALQALKARGEPWISKSSGKLVHKLGSPNPEKASKAACAKHSANADAFAAKVWPIIDGLEARGVHGYTALAVALAELKIEKSRGGTAWTATDVRNLMKRRPGAC